MSEDVYIKSGEQPRYFAFAGGVTKITSPAASSAILKESVFSTFQLISAAAATATIQGTNEALTATGTNANWVSLGTITLTGAGSDGFATTAPWRWVRVNVTTATATTSVIMGV